MLILPSFKISRMINVSLLSKICETPGAPGFEDKIRKVIIAEVKPYVDKIKIDAMGNLICLKKGSKKKRVMVAAHMDEISFMVKHIDSEGFIRFHPMGGFDPKTLTAQRVIIHGKKDIIGVMGSKPVHLMTEAERARKLSLSDFFIDTGLSVAEVKELVSIGDSITRERQLIEMGDCVNSKSIDNRVSVFILIETLKELANNIVPYDIYAVFTVQEEVGIRGATASSLGINPDFGFGLDTTVAFDLPGAKPEEAVTALGKGTAIKIIDGSVICDRRMVSYLKSTADRYNIQWQPEILPKGGTDTSSVQKFNRGGSIAGAISIPTRNLHSVIEMAHKKDIFNSIQLLKRALTDLHLNDWNWKV